MGIISQLTNFNSLIVFASAVGVPMGLIKYVSIWEKEGKWDEIRLIVGQLNTILLIMGVIAFLLNFFFARDISFFLFGNDSYYFLIILVSISIPFSLVNPIFEAILKGLKKFGHFVKISIFITIITLIISVLFVYYLHVEGAVISALIAVIIVTLVYAIYFHKTNLLKFSQLVSFNFGYSDNFKKIIKLGLASLIIGFADQLSQLLVRSDIIKILGIDANGLYQSIYSISQNYFSILFMSLGVYLLPILSEMRDKDLVNSEINSTLKLTFIIIVPLISTIYILREYIILFLYSKDFLPSTDLLFVNFLGDYFKAFSWIIGAWLIPLSRVRLWAIVSLFYYFNFLVIFLILINYFDFGLKSVVISYFISYVIHSVINLYFIIKQNNFKFTKFNSLLMPLSFCFILTLMIASNYDQTVGYIMIIPVLLLWFWISITKEEVTKALNMIKGKIFK